MINKNAELTRREMEYIARRERDGIASPDEKRRYREWMHLLIAPHVWRAVRQQQAQRQARAQPKRQPPQRR